MKKHIKQKMLATCASIFLSTILYAEHDSISTTLTSIALHQRGIDFTRISENKLNDLVAYLLDLHGKVSKAAFEKEQDKYLEKLSEKDRKMVMERLNVYRILD